jgi:flagellar biosynthesis/type III secretory pathway chaperone
MEVALLDLEHLLDEETAALRTLDRESIDRITFAKTEVCQRLTVLTRDGDHTPERKAQLEQKRTRGRPHAPREGLTWPASRVFSIRLATR